MLRVEAFFSATTKVSIEDAHSACCSAVAHTHCDLLLVKFSVICWGNLSSGWRPSYFLPKSLNFQSSNFFLDVFLADCLIRRQNKHGPTAVLVQENISWVHKFLVRMKGPATSTMDASFSRGGTTNRMINELRQGRSVAAFLTKDNMGTGVYWTLKNTRVSCFVIKLDFPMGLPRFKVQKLIYDPEASVEVLRHAVRSALGHVLPNGE